MQDAPPSHQPTADGGEEAEGAGDEEMNEDEHYEEEEEEEEEPQRVKLVCFNRYHEFSLGFLADPTIACWLIDDCGLI